MQNNNKISKPTTPKKLEREKSGYDFFGLLSKNCGKRLSDSGNRFFVNSAKLDAKSHYPEFIAKTCNDIYGLVNEEDQFEQWLEKNSTRPEPNGLYRCSRSFLYGSTSNYTYLKSITCGKDWCRDCGRLGSTSHVRRTSIVKPRILSLLEKTGSIQYLVITIPNYLQHHFYKKETLNDFRTYVRRKLKREGIGLGVMRWHWAGDDGATWKPHLNILQSGGYISKPTLAKWRAELSIWFRDYFKLNFKPRANFYTHYNDDPDKVRHWVNYIFRATLTVSANKQAKATIYKYRNTSIIGSAKLWDEIAGYSVKRLKLEESALKGWEIDEETGEAEKIHWHTEFNPDTGRRQTVKLPVCTFDEKEIERLGPGFFRRKRLFHRSDFIEVIKIPPDESPPNPTILAGICNEFRNSLELKPIPGIDQFQFTKEICPF
jgi:hypothetical protein